MSKMQVNRITDSDLSLIKNKLVYKNFGGKDDFAELHIYDVKDNLLLSVDNYVGYKANIDYAIVDNRYEAIEVSPEEDLKANGYSIGEYKMIYNFFRKMSSNKFFIKDISSDRTELILTSNEYDNDFIESLFNSIKDNFENLNYVKNILLNFGKNNQNLIVNIALDINSDTYNIIVKLYSPIVPNIGEKSLCSFVEEVIESNLVNINIEPITETPKENRIASPNYDLDLDEQSAFSTQYYSKDELLDNVQVNSINNNLINTTIKLNIDYTVFSNFVKYSGVGQRIKNFMLKITQLEKYALQKNTNKGNENTLNSKITSIIKSFDGYEFFLYNEENDKAYPKLNGVLLGSNSLAVRNWLGSDVDGQTSGILGEAKWYDSRNYDSLANNLPSYLLVDEQYEPFIVFCNMIGHHFDQIWTYSDKFTSIYENNNNPNKGISPDIIDSVLKSFGVKLYNSMSNVDLDKISNKSYNKEIYKRIYHNLPYINKSKGTRNGIKQLMSIFGVPDTLYRIYEYDNSHKKINKIQHIDDVFNYALTSNRFGYIDAPYKKDTDSLVPNSLLFRLKLNSKRVPNQIVDADFNKFDFNSRDFLTDEVYNDYSETLGVIKLNSNAYISIKSITINDTKTSICLESSDGRVSPPIITYLYDKNWRLFSIDRVADDLGISCRYELRVGEIINDVPIVHKTSIFMQNDRDAITDNYMSIELFRYLDYSAQKLLAYQFKLTDESFKTHLLNSTAISGNNVTDWQGILYYIPFGTDLVTYNHSLYSSINAKINSGHFDVNVMLYNYENRINYATNYDKIYYESVSTTGLNRVTDKIIIPDKKYYKKILSRYSSIEIVDGIHEDNSLLDVVFSPTFEQDDDIINTLGYFNIDDYIGNPSEQYFDSYVKLKELKRSYISKLIDRCNTKDYMNIVNYIDNSLFKMINDYLPIRNNSSVGISIKSNILNRIKIKSYKPESFVINSFTIDLGDAKYTSEIVGLMKHFQVECGIAYHRQNINPYRTIGKNVDKQLLRYFTNNQNAVLNNSRFMDVNSPMEDMKYNGVRLNSKAINKHSEGDISLGKSINFSSYTNKIGLFTDATSSEIFDKKTEIQVKYLVDKDGNLIDLNQLNRNVYDLRGIFPKDSFATISLFDNMKYSNQRTLDGNKKIYMSGFEHNLSLYFSNKDKYFKFDNTVDEIATTFRWYQKDDMSLTGKSTVYQLFDTKDIDLEDKFVYGNTERKAYSKYVINQSGQYDFNVNVSLGISNKDGGMAFDCKLSTYKNYVSDESIIDSVIYSYSPTNPVYDENGNEITTLINNNIIKDVEIPIDGQESMESFNSYWSNSYNSIKSIGGIIPYLPNRKWIWDGKTYTDASLLNYRIYVSDDVDAYKSGKLYEIEVDGVIKLQDIFYDYEYELANLSLPIVNFDITKSNTYVIETQGRGVLLYDPRVKSSGVRNAFIKGDSVLFVLEIINYGSDIEGGLTLLKSSSAYSIKNSANLKLDSTETLISKLTTSSLILNKKLIDYIGKGIFSMDNSTMYKKYGDINSNFDINEGDIFILKDGKSGDKIYIEVDKIEINSTGIVIYFVEEIPSYILLENITECLIINKELDESKIMIDFNKKVGQVSYGFIMPNNINPNFLDNIDVITKEVKLKLLNDYSINKNNV